MSAAETVKLTVDGREVEVPKGTGLVETALAAGVEIPVFCYEPRLGPPVGACRMCLVEIEGMPKLQAGCTLTAQDGMVVKTAQTSEKAKEGQEGTLEFLLVNHPLDCPVCDKGGECPLQDLTFRYGPGTTRMTFDKLTLDKPIPISPTIALDRERCILCYRCTRFSSDVAEDGQLVARNRGAATVIATFEDEAYRAHFSGNVIELCPVGALTSTQYRFEARPWEIQNVPTVCGQCPVGCNTQVTTREGKVKRVLSRNHPEIDQGWLCDKGRFTYTHLYAEDRILEPLRRVERAGLGPVSWDDALADLERLFKGAAGNVLVAFSGSETVEIAYSLSKVVRQGAAASAAVLPEETSDSLDAYRLPLSAIGNAQVIAVVGDTPVEERAPIVELWLKQAARNGAAIHRFGPAEQAQTAPGAGAQTCKELAAADSEVGKALRAADRSVVIWSGAGGAGGTHLAALAGALGLDPAKGSGAFFLPATPNGRGVAEAWAAAGDGAPGHPDEIGLLIVSGDEAANDPVVRDLAEQAKATIAITMFPGLAAGWADLILPATATLERDGTLVNLEGRIQRVRRTAIPPVPDELAWLSKLGAAVGVTVSAHAPLVFDEAFADEFGDVGEQAALPEPRKAATPAQAPAAEPPSPPRGGPLELLRFRPLFAGPAVERVPELQFQRPAAEVELAYDDAERRGIKPGDTVTVRSNGTSVELQAKLSRRLRAGVVRIAEEHAGDLQRGVEVSK
jgi:NADH-quinone oxidoreductase subunit G